MEYRRLLGLDDDGYDMVMAAMRRVGCIAEEVHTATGAYAFFHITAAAPTLAAFTGPWLEARRAVAERRRVAAVAGAVGFAVAAAGLLWLLKVSGAW